MHIILSERDGPGQQQLDSGQVWAACLVGLLHPAA